MGEAPWTNTTRATRHARVKQHGSAWIACSLALLGIHAGDRNGSGPEYRLLHCAPR